MFLVDSYCFRRDLIGLWKDAAQLININLMIKVRYEESAWLLSHFGKHDRSLEEEKKKIF
jgi:hypothetical protein